MQTTQRILALDVATKTGWFHTSGESGVVKLEGTTETKMEVLADWLRRTVERLGVDLIAYEEASYGASGRGGKVQWATVVFHNQLRGIVRLTAQQFGVECKPIHISTVKSFATGSGRATKAQMVRAFETFNRRKPVDDNEADAWGVLVAAERGAFMVKKPRKRKWKPTTKLKPGMLPGM